MPVIKIWCLPVQDEHALQTLHKAVVAAVVGIPELKLKDETDMTVLFPPDMMKYGLGSEIIVEVGGLFKKPERTDSVLQRLASDLGGAVELLYPEAKVECFISPPIDPAKGFWASDVPQVFAVNTSRHSQALEFNKPFDPNPLSSQGYRILEQDEREVGLTQIDLATIVFERYTYGIKHRISIQEVLDEIRAKSVIRLGIRFAEHFIKDQAAQDWMTGQKLHRLYLLGTTFADKMGIRHFPMVYRPNIGDRTRWKFKLDDQCELFIRPRLHFPTLPIPI